LLYGDILLLIPDDAQFAGTVGGGFFSTLVVVMEAAVGVGTTVMPMVVKNISTKEVRER
jgi:hypothetical protein